jgi:nucleoside-diphosphate-sugar epimerase
VANGRAVSVESLATTVERGVGTTLGRVHRPVRPGDVRNAAESAARLRRLGWAPSISLARGIRDLLDVAGTRRAG